MAIIVKIQGGLGNQLFQFAFGETLSHQLNQPLYLDLDSFTNSNRIFGLDKFNINHIQASVKNITNFFSVKNRLVNKYLPHSAFNKHIVHFEKENSFYNIPINLKGNAYYMGYWQSEQYFKPISLQLKQQITLQSALAKSTLLTIIQNNKTVAIHIRRGDYLKSEITKVHGIIGLEYYHLAIQIILKKIPDALFIIFSNDEDWVKVNLNVPGTCIYANTSNQYTDEECLILMSLCNHQIIANSTYSWWAAWLNSNPNKIIIAPEKWYAKKNTNNSLIPKSWLTL